MLDKIVYKLWFGSLRRFFRAIVRRALKGHSSILLGPLRGRHIRDSPNDKEWVYLLGIYELHVQRTLLSVLSRGDVVYDLCARNGFLSLLAAELVGSHGHVYAFEPLPANAQRIAQLIPRNR
jgi:hypothetical protein